MTFNSMSIDRLIQVQDSSPSMGLLTDPGAGRGKLTRILVNNHNKLCFALYLIGITWFLLLANDQFNAGTYFSENALLPGLVRGDFDEDKAAKTYQAELFIESESYPDSMPTSWLLAKFAQLHMDTYTHNFTLQYPLDSKKKYSGKNVYAILRAPRSCSSESLVLSTSYRTPNSIHPTTMPSIALMFSLAKYFRKQKYWAKDIIFLVTEHEQLGIQAWLEAYHGTSSGIGGVLDHGDLEGRGGAIQAAINLEIHSDRISHLDVKVEGLNGQLPNLDLVNLVHRMCSKENVRHTFKNRENFHYMDPYKEWSRSLVTLLSMVVTQATGVPSGNHGLFHRFGIEAVTLEGVAKGNVRSSSNPTGFYQMGRVLEGLFRSLNNLLERFHQSYFFYLLPAPDRYISIGMYMPPLGLLCASVLIKSFSLWLKMHDDYEPKQGKEQDVKEVKSKKNDKQEIKEEESFEEENISNEFSLVPVGLTIICTHAFGIILQISPRYLVEFGSLYLNWSTDFTLFSGFFIASVLNIVIPQIITATVTCNEASWKIVNMVGLLELGTLLLALGMQNFSLALFLGVIYVPFSLWSIPHSNGFLRFIQRILWIALHPFFLAVIIVTSITFYMYPLNEEPFWRAYGASKQAFAFSVVDSYIYGNWLFDVVSAVLLPNWTIFWLVKTQYIEKK